MQEESITGLDLPRLRGAYRELRYTGREPDFSAVTSRAGRPAWLLPVATAAGIGAFLVTALALGPYLTREVPAPTWPSTETVQRPAQSWSTASVRVRGTLDQAQAWTPRVQGLERPARPARLALAPPARWQSTDRADLG